MSNHGFLSSPTAFIRQIRQNLDEGRYTIGDTGLSIIKELIQNADDAGDDGASFIHLSVCDGLAEAKHPLLQSPALLVVNDGPFEEHDRLNIRRFGENSKSMDAGKIGKFGLGLKSLFHLCEAFFFFYAKNVPGKTEYRCDFLNPWWGGSDDDVHPEWDQICRGDKNLALQELKPLFKRRPCFAMWVPLRQQRQLQGNQPISPFFPGDSIPDWLSGDQLPGTIAGLLPLLRNLRDVRGFSGSGRNAQERFHLQVSDFSHRRQRIAELASNTQNRFSGAILRDGNSAISYYGIETRLHDTELSNRFASNFWPQDLGRDPATNKIAQVREKAEQHGACCVNLARSQHQNKGTLHVSWAVFLPLGNPEEVELSIPLDATILVHGYFFTDAGRNSVIGLTDNFAAIDKVESESNLKVAWNYRLAEVGGLPLIPQALSSAFAESKLEITDETIAGVTGAFSQSRMFRQARNSICSRYCWANVCDAMGRPEWKLLPAERKLLQLPGGHHASSLAWSVFPALSNLAEEFSLSFADDPILSHDSFSVDWHQEQASVMLDSVVSTDTANEPEHLDYLLEYLSSLKRSGSLSSVSDALIQLTRRMLLAAGLERLAEPANPLRRMIEFVSAERRTTLELEGEPNAELFSMLTRHDADVLIVPKSIDPVGDPSCGNVSSSDSVELLSMLSQFQHRPENSGKRESTSRIAAQLLSSSNDKTEVLDLCGDLPLFVAIDCRKRKDSEGADRQVLVTWNVLNQRRRTMMLFVQPPSFAYQLQNALADELIYLISGEVYKQLFPGVDSPPVCREKQIVETLSNIDTPILSDAAQRKPLLSILLKFSTGRKFDKYSRCVRYLLHGSREHFDSPQTLLVANPSHPDIWRRCVVRSLRSSDSTWKLIDPDLAGALTMDQRAEFNFTELDASSVAQELAADDPSHYQDLEPSDSEYAELLRAIGDVDLCRKLPIHRTVDGTFVAIDEGCFWESESTLPTDLQHSITVLAYSQDPDTKYRQKQLTRQLDDIAILKMAVSQPEPSRMWNLILDTLSKAENCPSEIWKQIADLPWLPMRNGDHARPRDVICLPRLHGEVCKIVAQHPGVFSEPSLIAQKVLLHDAYGKLTQCFASPAASLEMIGVLLKKDPHNRIGPVPESRFDDWIGATNEISSDEIRCTQFVAAAHKYFRQDVYALLRALTSDPISRQRSFDLLNLFREQHVIARSGTRKRLLLSVFNDYLRIATEEAIGREMLREQLLLNRSGHWVPSTKLAFANDGIADANVVDESIETVLGGNLNAMTQKNLSDSSANLGQAFNWDHVDNELAATGERLKKYFRVWQDIIPHEQIGGFLALMGDATSVRKLAEQYLGSNRTVDQTRLNFGLSDWTSKTNELIEDGPTMIAKQRVIVEVVATPTVSVLNLFGESIEANRNTRPKSIFVNYGKPNFPFPHKVVNEKRFLCFRLNQIDTPQMTPGELSELLRDSVVKLIGQAYNQLENQTQFADAWDDLSESDQLDISIAQARIVDNAFLILATYGLKNAPMLADVIDQWNSAQKLDAEQRSCKAVSKTGSRNAAAELDTARQRLRDILETDDSAQQHIIDAVRHRISHHYQYTRSAIPFEIFQNADDACEELRLNFNDALREDAATVFHVYRNDTRLAFAHFGRCINQYPLGNAGLRGKFDDDLWKMLVLNLSNKTSSGDETNASQVTGKFGLGFKSCYLVSDRPRVVSGRLAFEVKGAMYPKRLIRDEKNERSTLDDIRDSFGQSGRHATLIELTLDHATADDVVNQFIDLCNLQVVFSRCISSIVLDACREVSWNPQPLKGVTGCYVGSLCKKLTDENGGLSSTGLVFKSNHGAMLLKFDARGIEPFDPDIPTIWVTAPTGECLDVGFLLNGAFNLDVGRAQLSRDQSENEKVASELGMDLGLQLVEFYEATSSLESWGRCVSQLGLAADVTRYELFDSLFDVLCESMARKSRSDEPGHKLLRDVFWSSDSSAAAMLYARTETLPSRLPGDHALLVDVASVRFLLTGILEQQSELFETVSSWDSFRAMAPVGSIVSEPNVSRPLRKLRPQMLSMAEPLDIKNAIEWEVGKQLIVDAVTAERLGRVITRQLVLESDEWGESHDLKTLLRKVKFKGLDGKFHRANELLLSKHFGGDANFATDPKDELMRARFAPNSRLLASEYQGPSLAFFDACRGEMEAPSRLMAEWTIQAGDLERRAAALQYMAKGTLGRQLISELMQRGLERTWLENVAHSEAFLALSETERWHLRDLLPADERPSYDWNSIVKKPQAKASLSTPEILQTIHQWWTEVRRKPQDQFGHRTFIGEYTRRIYPQGKLRDLENDDFAGRRDWTILLLLGLFHTQGRSKPGQHRGFLKKCHRNGWLDLFASPDRDPSKWIGFIEEYLKEDVDDFRYLHWMRQFVGIFQLNSHLDDYIELFRSIDRIREPFNLTSVTNPQTSHLYQRGGLCTPPLSRQLGLGACFVVRELIRLRILDNDFAHPHCYVPTKQIREMLKSLGCENLDLERNRWEMSVTIYDFVAGAIGEDKANFHCDFDIPLYFVANVPDLRQQLFANEFYFADTDEAEYASSSNQFFL